MNDDVFWEPAAEATAEMKIKRSLFIGHIFPCRESEGVRAVLAMVEAKHRNANHNCFAYCLAEGRLKHSSDDGEPSGTAGKPILAAIMKSGMVNLIVIVTRYFGGIKLGVRGLIEAYGQTAASVLSLAERVERTRSNRLAVRLPYSEIGDIAHLLSAYGTAGAPVWKYGAEAEVSADIKISAAPKIAVELDELQARKLIYSWNWLF